MREKLLICYTLEFLYLLQHYMLKFFEGLTKCISFSLSSHKASIQTILNGRNENVMATILNYFSIYHNCNFISFSDCRKTVCNYYSCCLFGNILESFLYVFFLIASLIHCLLHQPLSLYR
jgi:hypothetical protein